MSDMTTRRGFLAAASVIGTGMLAACGQAPRNQEPAEQPAEETETVPQTARAETAVRRRGLLPRDVSRAETRALPEEIRRIASRAAERRRYLP